MPVIVMEKMDFSLTGFVEKHNDIDISFRNTVTILNDVCSGLQYLHNRTPPIVHRDLTPNNILLCHHRRAKITDLGVARTLQTTDTKLTKTPGTPDFMSPECLTDNPVYGLPLDIFSFGGVILHITTRQWPTPSSLISFDHNTGEKSTISEVQRRQQYLDKMSSTYVKFKPLVISCLDDNPSNRPTAEEVLTEIKTLHKTGGVDYFEIWTDTDQQSQQEEQLPQSQQGQPQQQEQQKTEKQNYQKEQEQGQQLQEEQQLGMQQHQQINQQQPMLTEDRKQLKEIPKRKKTVFKNIFSRKSRSYPPSESEDASSDSELSDTGGSQTSSLSQEDAFDDDEKPPPSVEASKPNLNYPLFIAKYDFLSKSDEDLSFKKGDQLYIINPDEGDWWYAKAKHTGREGYIPHNHVTKLRPPKPKPRMSSYPLYVAKYDYFSSEGLPDKYLRFRKGDLFYILNSVEGDWWFARAKHSGQEGYVPNNYVAKTNTLEAEDWFFGAITRKHAENLLMQSFNDCGSFLIRNSESTPGDYSLSIKFKNAVGHYRIKHNSRGYCISNWKATFESISQLVEHYGKRSGGLCINLKYTCLITKPCTASSAEEVNENWEVDRRSIQFVKKIGAGQFGEVWQGIWNGGTEVAVKILNPGIISATEFFEETALMKQLTHSNLIQLYAVCTQEEPIYILTELMKHGSLLEYLRHDGRSLKLPQLIDMGAQVAAGMAYLEEKSYVHRDLAARNILITENLICKVKSFSMVRILSEGIYEAHTGAKFPVKWTAPEAAMYNHFTIKSDVWSFGILLYELITYGRFPYPGMNNAQVLEALQNDYRMPCPMGCPEGLYGIMRECWREEADSRPTFESLRWRMDDFFVENEPTHLYPHQVQ